MKSSVIIFLCVALTATACTKSHTTKRLQEENGCVERISIAVTDHSIKSVDVQAAHNLFVANNIDDSRYRYFSYTMDTLQTLYPPYAKYSQKTIRVDQYINGLRIFTNDLVYNFLNDKFNFLGGHLTNGTSLDTIAQLTVGQLRKLHLDYIEQFDHASGIYKDSCLDAEFGYFNLNAGISYAPEILAKAWCVTIKKRQYPLAYYKDNDGALIYYDNGIRTFK